jgi:hypothetical protein
MSSYSVDKLLGVLDAPNSQAELAAAVGGFLKELDTMAKTNSKGYGNLLKEMGEKAGVQLPEDFVQRVAGEAGRATPFAGCLVSHHTYASLAVRWPGIRHASLKQLLLCCSTWPAF